MASILMPELFNACVDVLTDRLLPLNYRDLTRTAITRMGRDPDQIEDLEQLFEDVREKLLLYRRRGTFYCSPYGALQRWFKRRQAHLFTPALEVVLPTQAEVCIAAGVEALMRAGYMTTKNAMVCAESRAEGIVRGLMLEFHVRRYFETRWPEFVLPPENDGKYKEYCFHDFRIRIGDSLIGVDVWGQDRYLKWSLPQGKHPTDIHLVCRLRGAEVHEFSWEGVVRGDKLTEVTGNPLVSGFTYPPEVLIVWLNCLQSGIDYRSFQEGVEP